MAMRRDDAMASDTHPGIVEAMWRYRVMSAGIILVMVLISVATALVVAPRARATGTIALATPPENSVLAPGIQGDASLARYTAQRAGFVTSDAVLENVAAKLGSDDITALRRDISASPSATSNTVTITAEADTSEKAVALADAAVAAYRAETLNDVNRLTDAAVKSIRANAEGIPATAPGASDTQSGLAIQASEIQTSSALFGDGVEFVMAPRKDAVTLPSIPLREAAIGLLLGLVLAATAAWIRADREQERERIR
jgi:capsular polysaccharide biosynthesis protein